MTPAKLDDRYQAFGNICRGLNLKQRSGVGGSRRSRRDRPRPGHHSLYPADFQTEMLVAVDLRPGVIVADNQGLTRVHFSAQLEPCLSQENTLHAIHIP